jgi:hypothetical protein
MDRSWQSSDQLKFLPEGIESMVVKSPNGDLSLGKWRGEEGGGEEGVEEEGGEEG